MTKAELTKCVNGIARYEEDLYDIIFIHTEGGKIHYIRAVSYDVILIHVITFINLAHLRAYGVYQHTRYKSDILILLSD